MTSWLVAAALAASIQDVRLAQMRLEARLLAPCCYVQTLDAHQSPLSTQLRSEVHERLTRGDSAEAIEADLVHRYGERVRAVPKAFSIDSFGGGIVASLAVVSLAWFGWWLRRLRPSRGALQPVRQFDAADEDSRWRERLDAELDRID